MTTCVIYNASAARCGFKNFGEQLVAALTRYGDGPVVVHDGTHYDAWQPFPDEAYDRYLMVWHPGTLGHYFGSTGWPAREQLTIWVGEIPPYADCNILGHFHHRWSADSFPGATGYFHGYPIVDWIEDLPEPLNDPFSVGTTGVRREGLEGLIRLCGDNSWNLNIPYPEWQTPEDEIRRLARSHVNVCWYGDRRLEAASAPCMALASGRPLIINDSPMLAHVGRLPNVFTWGNLDLALEWAHRLWLNGHLLRHTVPPARGWKRTVEQMLDHWNGVA